MLESLEGSDLVAIAGILGTLAGLIIGTFTTYKIQARALAHEDSTRFHDKRVDVYAEFTRRANDVVSYYMQQSYSEQAEFEFEETIHLLRLIGSKTVVHYADLVHAIVGELQDPAHDGQEIAVNLVTNFKRSVEKFVEEARNELQTD